MPVAEKRLPACSRTRRQMKRKSDVGREIDAGSFILKKMGSNGPDRFVAAQIKCDGAASFVRVVASRMGLPLLGAVIRPAESAVRKFVPGIGIVVVRLL